jgi:hypothetical protein
MKRLSFLVLLGVIGTGGSVHAEDGKNIASSPETVRPLLIGASVPDLVLQTGEAKPFDLNKALAGKPTMLILYRGGW